MFKTHIFLTDHQWEELTALAKAMGMKQSDLIREAIDRFIDQEGPCRREAVLCKTAGMWKNRTDLPDFERLRGDWGRN